MFMKMKLLSSLEWRKAKSLLEKLFYKFSIYGFPLMNSMNNATNYFSFFK